MEVRISTNLVSAVAIILAEVPVLSPPCVITLRVTIETKTTKTMAPPIIIICSMLAWPLLFMKPFSQPLFKSISLKKGALGETYIRFGGLSVSSLHSNLKGGEFC
jgi:hypothetical protein